MINSTVVWQSFSNAEALSPEELHLVRLYIPAHRNRLENYWLLLNAEERARADRYYFEKDRQQFVIARGCLRMLLAHYLNQNPAQLTLNKTAHGKLYLEDRLNYAFNLSHAGEWVLYGFLLNGLLGVDVEYAERKIEHLDLAQRFFTATEYDYLKWLPVSEQQQAFYQLWTCKEAVVKALGTGLSHSLKTFSIDLMHNQITFLEESEESERWRLLPFLLDKDYHAAVVYPQKKGDKAVKMPPLFYCYD